MVKGVGTMVGVTGVRGRSPCSPKKLQTSWENRIGDILNFILCTE